MPEMGVGVFLGLGGDGVTGGTVVVAQEELNVGVYSGVVSLEGGKVRVSVGKWREAVAVKRLRKRVKWEVERGIRALAERRGRGVAGVDAHGEGDGGMMKREGGGDWAIDLLRGIGLEKGKDGVAGVVKS